MGSGYVIDHCISAFNALEEEKLYKAYVTDALKILVGGERRYVDIVKQAYSKETKETASEIIERLSSGLDALGGENSADIV